MELVCCFAEVGMGWARTEATDNRKRETSHKLCGGPSLASPPWLLLKLFPPAGSPAFPSSLPNRVLQAAGSGLHPKGSLFLHDPLTEPPLVCFFQNKAGLVPSFLSPRLSCDPHTDWDHTSHPLGAAEPRSKEHQLPVITLLVREGCPVPSERLLNQWKLDLPQILCMEKSVGYTSREIHCVPLDAPWVIGTSVSKTAWKYLFYNVYTYFTPI